MSVYLIFYGASYSFTHSHSFYAFNHFTIHIFKFLSYNSFMGVSADWFFMYFCNCIFILSSFSAGINIHHHMQSVWKLCPPQGGLALFFIRCTEGITGMEAL
jgi:hypothetical protein